MATALKSRTVELHLPQLHGGQQRVKDNARRYNVLCWGRRGGKTVFGADRGVETTVVKGGTLGWFAPNYKILNPVWDYFVDLFADLIVDRSEQDHYLKLVTGGVFECWSMDAGIVARSRSYHRIVVDEAAFISDLKTRWERELQPTLVDYKGDSYFFSTPNGHNDFEEFFNFTKTDSEWASFRLPTWENPHLPQEERERVRYLAEVVQDQNARQEYGAEFVDAVDSFIPSLTWWDSCYDKELPPFNPRQGMVLGVDGAKRRDCFAVVGAQRHPIRRDDAVIRYSRVWKPEPGQPLNLTEIGRELLELKTKLNWHIVQVAYDPFQLELMMEGLSNIYWCEPFIQQADRELADRFLLDAIISSKVSHDGTHTELKKHLGNADRKVTGLEDNRLRIVKGRGPVDMAVACSMSVYRCLRELNL